MKLLLLLFESVLGQDTTARLHDEGITQTRALLKYFGPVQRKFSQNNIIVKAHYRWILPTKCLLDCTGSSKWMWHQRTSKKNNMKIELFQQECCCIIWWMLKTMALSTWAKITCEMNHLNETSVVLLCQLWRCLSL